MINSAKDPRYITVKFFLKKGHITTFRDIFKYIPYTVVANDLHTNNNRMKRLIEDPGLFHLYEIYKLADLIEYDKRKFGLFIMEDVDRMRRKD